MNTPKNKSGDGLASDTPAGGNAGESDDGADSSPTNFRTGSYSVIDASGAPRAAGNPRRERPPKDKAVGDAGEKSGKAAKEKAGKGKAAGDKAAKDKPRRSWRARAIRGIGGALKDRAELLELVREAHAGGMLDAELFTMLEGALAMADLQVRDVMVPRAQMVCLRRDDGVTRIVPEVTLSGHSRFPVLDGDKDDVVGILLAKDLLRFFSTGPAMGTGPAEKFDMREFLRPAVFVPESKRLNILLKEFRGNRNHMAIVVDEYGGVAGLVTIEDVIEQIIGEIDDEFDIEEDQNIGREDDHHFLVRGVTPIEEFNEYFGTRLSDEEFNTVAGLVMQQFGRVPRRGESVVLANIEFRVQRTDRRRLDSLRVTLPE